MSTESRARSIAEGGAWECPSLLPRDEPSLRVLRQRAELLARGEDAQLEATDLYIRFQLGNEHFGVPYRFMEEILPGAEPTRVPGVPPHIAGVVSRRGELLTVIDLRALFRTGSGERRDAGVLVVRAAGITCGLYAPHIEGNEHYAPAALHPAIPSPGVRNVAHVAGIHEGRVTLLDLEALLADPSLRVDTGA